MVKATKPVYRGRRLDYVRRPQPVEKTVVVDKVDSIIAERRGTHGDPELQFDCAQRIKECFRDSTNWDALTQSQKETLEMIATKVSRILEGDPNEPEHWLDAGGYAKCEYNILMSKVEE